MKSNFKTKFHILDWTFFTTSPSMFLDFVSHFILIFHNIFLSHLQPSSRIFVSGHSEEVLGHHHHHLSLGGLGGHLDHHQSLAELLRTTTLEEFLHAVEKVEAEDEQLIGEKLIGIKGLKKIGVVHK